MTALESLCALEAAKGSPAVWQTLGKCDEAAVLALAAQAVHTLHDLGWQQLAQDDD